MNVSVIIVAYHGDKWLPACFDSLVEASTRRIHVVLVDNAGNSGFGELGLERFDCEIVKTPRPMGFAEANNHALIHAARLEDTVLFLNQDTISTSGWIGHCIHCLEHNPRLGAVSPLIRTYDGSGWDPSFRACLTEGDLALLSDEPASDAAPLVVANAPAPALIVRTDVLKETGPFDPVFGSYYEDYDLCRRIRAAGFQVAFCPQATVKHFSGSATTDRAKELKRMRQIIRNRLLFRVREATGGRGRILARHLLADLPRNLVRGMLGTPSSQPVSVTLGAHGDLLRIAGRLVSAQKDEAVWQAYLDEMGWPECVNNEQVAVNS